MYVIADATAARVAVASVNRYSNPYDSEAYPPIESYAVVGNLETCALVGPDGPVDWFPFPHLESPSVFAATLDADRGGQFRISPKDSFETRRRYVDDTNVRETTVDTDGQTATVTDFMPPADRVDHPTKVPYRKVTATNGQVDLEVFFEPRFDYGRVETAVESVDEGVRAAGGGERTLLESPVDLETDVENARITGDLSLEAGETAWFLLRCTGADDANTDPDAALAETLDSALYLGHARGDETPGPEPMGVRLGEPVDTIGE